jgi:hypothetical protein
MVATLFVDNTADRFGDQKLRMSYCSTPSIESVDGCAQLTFEQCLQGS